MSGGDGLRPRPVANDLSCHAQGDGEEHGQGPTATPIVFLPPRARGERDSAV